MNILNLLQNLIKIFLTLEKNMQSNMLMIFRNIWQRWHMVRQY